MKKSTLTIILVVLTIAFARAQSEKKFAFGLTGNFTLPGNDDYGYVDGFGISAKIEYAISAKLRFAFIPGYFTEASNDRNFYKYTSLTTIAPPGPAVVYKFVP